MLKYALISINESLVRYFYYPEGKVDYPGIVEFNRLTGDFSVVEESDMDYKNYYGNHMCQCLIEQNKTGNFRESGLVARC